jgi:uncharacterized membrane protein YgdD (TMEM256/DUF423 family)
MNARCCLVLGGLLAAAGVLLGAFGAHGLDKFLEGRISDPGELEHQLRNFETAVRYQMYHAVGLVLVGLVALRRRSACTHIAAWAFLIGIALFCGLLYAIVFGGPNFLGRIVPIGGVSMIAGWVALAVAGWRVEQA